MFDVSCNKIKKLPSAWAELAKSAFVILDGNSAEVPSKSKWRPVVPSKKWKVDIAEMVGRRPTQEDAFLVDGQFGENEELYGVFDGHAGSLAAEFCGEHYGPIFREMLSKAKNVNVCFDLANI